MPANQSARRSWLGVAVLATVLSGWMDMGQTATGAASSATTATSTAPLSLTAWKQQYEPAIGQIADDALVVFDTGVKDAKHPTKKKVKAIVSACEQWHSDAEKLPGEVPPIPLTSAEKTWQSLISASISGSSDCTAALQDGTRSVVKEFQKNLALVDADESKLINELGAAN